MKELFTIHNYVSYQLGQVKAVLADMKHNIIKNSYHCTWAEANYSVMENKYISTQSSKILTYFNQMNRDCFDYSEAETAFSNSSKSALKEINSTVFHKKLEHRLPQYEGRWQSSMADQIMGLPDFDRVVREVMRHLRGLE